MMCRGNMAPARMPSPAILSPTASPSRGNGDAFPPSRCDILRPLPSKWGKRKQLLRSTLSWLPLPGGGGTDIFDLDSEGGDLLGVYGASTFSLLKTRVERKVGQASKYRAFLFYSSLVELVVGSALIGTGSLQLEHSGTRFPAALAVSVLGGAGDLSASMGLVAAVGGKKKHLTYSLLLNLLVIPLVSSYLYLYPSLHGHRECTNHTDFSEDEPLHDCDDFLPVAISMCLLVVLLLGSFAAMLILEATGSSGRQSGRRLLFVYLRGMAGRLRSQITNDGTVVRENKEFWSRLLPSTRQGSSVNGWLPWGESDTVFPALMSPARGSRATSSESEVRAAVHADSPCVEELPATPHNEERPTKQHSRQASSISNHSLPRTTSDPSFHRYRTDAGETGTSFTPKRPKPRDLLKCWSFSKFGTGGACAVCGKDAEELFPTTAGEGRCAVCVDGDQRSMESEDKSDGNHKSPLTSSAALSEGTKSEGHEEQSNPSQTASKVSEAMEQRLANLEDLLTGIAKKLTSPPHPACLPVDGCM
eukprot:Sspe_Gene.37592::Locus_18147_Transcript_1_1_Confidence_1.000_Length_1649::g.37592::m.37592